MHDLPDAYSKAIAAAIARASEARRGAAALFDDALDKISAAFEADVAEASMTLEAGMEARLTAFRGVHPFVPNPDLAITRADLDRLHALGPVISPDEAEDHNVYLRAAEPLVDP